MTLSQEVRITPRYFIRKVIMTSTAPFVTIIVTSVLAVKQNLSFDKFKLIIIII
jgi:hypothetical protein